MFEILPAAGFICLYLIIWFKTDAFIEYVKLFRLNNWFKVNQYIDLALADPSYTYIDFLIEYYNNFFTRLITCPICTSVWLGLFLSYFVGICSMPLVSVLGLAFYYILVKIM